METHRRSLMKSLSWRVVATVVTACAAWFITGEQESAAKIAALDTLAKIGIYYAHERFWIRIPFGRPKPPDYQI
ncbi:MAG: DUF2061 domain-containing protein [bacterium]